MKKKWKSRIYLSCVLIIFLSLLYYSISIQETIKLHIPQDVSSIIVESGRNDVCYVIQDQKEIHRIVRSMRRVSEHIYCNESYYRILFVQGDFTVACLPYTMSGAGYPSKTVKLLGKYLENEHYKYNVNYYSIPETMDFAQAKAKLQRLGSDLVYSPTNSNVEMHSSIELEYQDQEKSGLVRTCNDFLDECGIKTLPSDQVFTPIIKMLEEKNLLFSSSKIQYTRQSTDGSFSRKVRLYLKESISDQLYNELRERWILKDDPTSRSINFNKLIAYTIKTISKGEIFKSEMERLWKEDRIKINSH